MHTAHFHKILRENPKLDVFSSIKNVVDREKAKRLIVKLILATDVTKHFPNLASFSKKVECTLDKTSPRHHTEAFDPKKF